MLVKPSCADASGMDATECDTALQAQASAHGGTALATGFLREMELEEAALFQVASYDGKNITGGLWQCQNET